jgi:uncharacterized protein
MQKIKSLLLLLAIVVAWQNGICQTIRANKILIFSKTTGFRHASIADGKIALLAMAAANGFAADTTEDAGWFTTTQLQQYKALVFLNTTGNLFDSAQKQALVQYMRNGGGFAGIHAATDTEYQWPWYNLLVGGYFESHPKPQTAKFVIVNRTHPSTAFFTDSIWLHHDELYNFKQCNPNVKTLITIDEKSYSGGNMGNFHPMAWYHAYEGGRAFYTALGHTSEAWQQPQFLQHVLGGIRYAMGQTKQ